MYENGIFHNDLKPANVFIHKLLLAVIGDFGTTKISKNSETETEDL